jgi:signal peptidase II
VFDRLRPYANFWLVSLLVLAADQLTKFLVVRHIEFADPDIPGSGQTISVLGETLHLVHVGNKGAAWGAGAGHGATPFFLVGLALAVLAFVWFKRREFLHELEGGQFAFGLFIGGAVGNVCDRVARSHVVDFVDIRLPFRLFGSYHWPAFNVADACICVGVALYFVLLWRQDRRLRERIEAQSGGNPLP